MEMGEQVERGGREGKALNNDDDERARLGASALVARIAARPRFHKRRMSAAAAALACRRLSRPGGEVRALRVEKAPPEGRGGGGGGLFWADGRTDGRREED